MIQLRGKQMPVIDAHVHVWDHFNGCRFGSVKTEPLGFGMVHQGDQEFLMLPPELYEHRVPFGVLERNMILNGIDKAVILQNPCYGDQRDYVRDIMESHPGSITSLGMIDPRNRTEVIRQMDILFHEYHFIGFKIEVPDVPFFLDDPEYDFLWKKIIDMGAIVAFDLGWNDGPFDFNIDRFKNVMIRFPNLRAVLCHLGVSKLWDVSQQYPFPLLQKTLSLLEINKENLYFDFSGMQCCDPSREYPYYRCLDFLKVAKSMGAMNKIMWGSDAPMIQRTCTYRQTLTSVVNYCPFLTDDEMEDLLYRTAEKVYFSK